MMVLLLGGCGTRTEDIKTLSDMKDKSLSIAIPDDIDVKEYVLDICPKAEIVSQNDVMYGVRSVSEGKVNAFIAGTEYISKAVKEANIKHIKVLDEPLHVYECALGISKLCKIPDFEAVINETISRMISDGTIAEMRNRWFDRKIEEMPEIKLSEDPVYTIEAVTFGQSKPYSYFDNGKLSGFDVELVYRVCRENNWGLNLSNAEYTGMLMGLSTGRYDLISANLYVTDNRAENISFSVPYNSNEISIAVYDSADADPAGKSLPKPEYADLSELSKAKNFAGVTGSVFDTFVRDKYPDVELSYYANAVDCALAVVNGKSDAFVFDVPMLNYLALNTDGVALMPEYMAKDNYSFITAKTERGMQLQQEFNQWLDQQKRSGELDRIYEFWCSADDPGQIFDFGALPDINGFIRIATSPECRPSVYYYNNQLTGYPIELIYDFCRDRGYGADISVMQFEGIIPSVISGKSDIAVDLISYTDERAESVLFTDRILEGGVGVLVRAVDTGTKEPFWNSLRNSLRKTFITENRWKLIASGLGATIEITLGGFILANILGAAFCACRMSKRRALNVIADIYDRIMQGTPMVVVLMILYYVIFGKTNVSGILVAILAFGLNSGASLAQQFCGSISGVDKGQTEAALALGFTKFETFMQIVLPQAARTALPGYFSEIIGLMKGTAIVGYIAVIDLTKSGDLIRSSTYDAFVPLLSVAFIYFLISFVILSLLKYCNKRLSPKRIRTQEVEK